MKSPLLLCGAVVTLVTGGYIAGRSQGTASRPAHNGPAVTKRPLNRPVPAIESGSRALLSDFLKGNTPGELTAEDAYQLLRPWLEKTRYNDFDRTRDGMKENLQLRLLADELPLPILRQVLARARDGTFPLDRSHELFSAYAVRDWDEAMAWAKTQQDAEVLKMEALGHLSEIDPDRAAAICRAPNAGSILEADSVIISNLARHYSKRGKAAFSDFLESIPAIHESRVVWIAMENLPDEELSAFLDFYRGRGEARKSMMDPGDLMIEVVDREPEKFQQWRDTLTPERRADLDRQLAWRRMTAGRNAEATEHLQASINGYPGNTVDFVREKLLHWTEDPVRARILKNALPSGIDLTSIDAEFPKSSDPFSDPFNDTVTGIAVAKLLSTQEDQADYLVRAFDRLDPEATEMRPDFDKLAEQIKGLEITGAASDRIGNALDRARKRLGQEIRK